MKVILLIKVKFEILPEKEVPRRNQTQICFWNQPVLSNECVVFVAQGNGWALRAFKLVLNEKDYMLMTSPSYLGLYI